MATLRRANAYCTCWLNREIEPSNGTRHFPDGHFPNARRGRAVPHSSIQKRTRNDALDPPYRSAACRGAGLPAIPRSPDGRRILRIAFEVPAVRQIDARIAEGAC
jgi:hypothetical protein